MKRLFCIILVLSIFLLGMIAERFFYLIAIKTQVPGHTLAFPSSYNYTVYNTISGILIPASEVSRMAQEVAR